MSSDFVRTVDREPEHGARDVRVVRYGQGRTAEARDVVAMEEPLEIRLGFSWRGRPAQKSLSVTMRTPGDERELAAGFLFGEGMIAAAEDIEAFEFCAPADGAEPSANLLRVCLAEHVEVDTKSLTRHFYTTSSCGVCGKASIEALQVDGRPVLDPSGFETDAARICELPAKLRAAQAVFEDTGGLHACGLFDAAGALVDVREDVGRHNAMDKLIGARLLAGALPLADSVVMLSGRASFELLHKAVMAEIPIVVAVGAPSSLAVDVAQEFGVTLVGFARDGRFNIYSHPERIRFGGETQ